VCITDLMGAVQVYAGTDAEDGLCQSAPTLIRGVCDGQTLEIDLVSAAEFINTGIPSFPYTLHRNVRELQPGAVHTFLSANGGGISCGSLLDPARRDH
jgi:hypothetical protein